MSGEGKSWGCKSPSSRVGGELNGGAAGVDKSSERPVYSLSFVFSDCLAPAGPSCIWLGQLILRSRLFGGSDYRLWLLDTLRLRKTFLGRS